MEKRFSSPCLLLTTLLALALVLPTVLGGNNHPYAFEKPNPAAQYSFQPRMGSYGASPPHQNSQQQQPRGPAERSRTTLKAADEHWLIEEEEEEEEPSHHNTNLRPAAYNETLDAAATTMKKGVVKRRKIVEVEEGEEEGVEEEDADYDYEPVHVGHRQQQQQPQQQQQQQAQSPSKVHIRRQGGTPHRKGVYKSKNGVAATPAPAAPVAAAVAASASTVAGKEADEYYDDDYEQDEVAVKDDSRRTGQGGSGGGYGGGGGGGGYGGGGGGGYGGGNGLNPLALLVAPLAAIALLAAAAAVALNPVMVSLSVTGKRRRRSDENHISQSNFLTPDMEEKMEEMKVLEEFLDKMPTNDSYQQRLLSMYLSCSGFTEEKNLCLDRVVCEFSSPNSTIAKKEKDVISIILFQIMGNGQIDEGYKERLRRAAKRGRALSSSAEGKCAHDYPCATLDTPS